MSQMFTLSNDYALEMFQKCMEYENLRLTLNTISLLQIFTFISSTKGEVSSTKCIFLLDSTLFWHINALNTIIFDARIRALVLEVV